MSRRRWLRPRWIISGAVAASVALVAGGWFAATAFQSPAQREAAAAPPEPGIVTARVERGDLVRTATLRLRTERRSREDVGVPTQPDDLAVVTAQPAAAGSVIGAGDVALEVNGRPVIALPGEFGYYRPLSIGDEGPDVDQLQRGLMAAGFLNGHDGVFGAPTDNAVRQLYERAHAAAPTERVAAATGTGAADEEGPSTESEHVVLRPADVLVVSELPAIVVGSPTIGDVLSPESHLTVERGGVQAVAEISSTAASGLTTDTLGVATIGDRRVKVRVTAVDDAGETEGTRRVRVAGADAPLPTDLVGQDVVATLDIHVAAEDALLVPTRAVEPGGDEPASVLVQHPQGFRRVPVEELGTLDGRSAVRPLDERQLRAGDDVRVR